MNKEEAKKWFMAGARYEQAKDFVEINQEYADMFFENQWTKEHDSKSPDTEIDRLAWTNEEESNKRMNVIGQNGNDGHHYKETNTQQTYGDEDVDEGEWDDAYWGAV